MNTLDCLITKKHQIVRFRSKQRLCGSISRCKHWDLKIKTCRCWYPRVRVESIHNKDNFIHRRLRRQNGDGRWDTVLISMNIHQKTGGYGKKLII